MMVVLACSDDDKRAEPSDVFPDQDGDIPSDAAPSTLCGSYCEALVDNAPGCETYNNGGRCESICNFYRDSVCQTTWEAYAECMRDSKQAECVLPAGGKLTLVISSCHAEFNTWDQCREEKDAGICNY